MSEENGKTEFTDAYIKNYLLGTLGEAQREEIERRLLSDDAFFDRLLLVEVELIDDYAGNQLTADERNNFEQFFLVTDERRKKLKFAVALQKHVQRKPDGFVAPAIVEKSLLEKLSEFFGIGRPVLTFAAIALILLFGFGIWFFLKPITLPGEPEFARRDDLTKPSPGVQPQISPAANASPAITPALSPESVAANNSSQPNRNVNARANQNNNQPAPPQVLATLILKPGVLRDSGELARLTLPADKNGLVNLQLDLEPSNARRFQAEIVTAENRPVLLRTFSVRPDTARLSLQIPTNLLRAGDYQIKLTTTAPEGETVSAGRYAFRVLAK